MKILVIDNAAIHLKAGAYCCNGLTGEFLSDLKMLGHDVSVVQFVTPAEHSINTFDLRASGIRVYTLKDYGNKLLNYIFGSLSLLFFLLRVDFVYMFYPNSLKYILVFSLLFNIKFGLYIRGMVGVDNRISRYLYKKSTVVFTVSNYFTEFVNRVVGRNIAYTIRPMIPYTDADVIRNRCYLPKDKYHILFLGRISKDKGLFELVEATEMLKKRGYDFTIQIVGDGDFCHELDDQIKSKELSDIVCIEGPVYNSEKKANFYKCSDIYILPTYHEGFPRTLYEAMIFGTPVVTTFVGGISSLMKDKENCVRIEPRSTDSIVQGLQYAMEHYEEMGRMAQNGTKLVSAIVDRNRLTHAQHLCKILKENEG